MDADLLWSLLSDRSGRVWERFPFGSCWHIVMLLVLMGSFLIYSDSPGYLSTNMDHGQSVLFNLSVEKKQMVRSKLTQTCTMTF